jgi:Kef-type K+ transport system membrane component KefB
VSANAGALFLGASMAMTAFPMLARIIEEKGLSGTRLGTLALAAGSVDDAAAWAVLAVVLASITGDSSGAVWAIGGGVVFVVGVLVVGRPLFAKLGAIVEKKGTLDASTLSVVLTVVMLGAWFTDFIGLYEVFGAFMVGVAMPRGLFAKELERLLGPAISTLLVPLFFVASGLTTRLALVDTADKWLLAVAVIVVAVVGKAVACFVAAKAAGETTRDAMALGTLMNTRGMMGLIILNVGLEHGILKPTLFAVMVLMAVGTTLATAPVFDRVARSGTAPAA